MKDKSQAEKAAAERQVELLSTALGSAPSAKGYWLNASGKTYPSFYPKGYSKSVQCIDDVIAFGQVR